MELIYRCQDGHLFVARSWLKLLVASLHFGARKFLRCPVDHHWRMAASLSRNDLTDDQLAEARAYQY